MPPSHRSIQASNGPVVTGPSRPTRTTNPGSCTAPTTESGTSPGCRLTARAEADARAWAEFVPTFGCTAADTPDPGPPLEPPQPQTAPIPAIAIAASSRLAPQRITRPVSAARLDSSRLRGDRLAQELDYEDVFRSVGVVVPCDRGYDGCAPHLRRIGDSQRVPKALVPSTLSVTALRRAACAWTGRSASVHATSAVARKRQRPSRVHLTLRCAQHET
jgi:hypothetical protein